MSGMEPHSNPNYQAIPLTGQVPGRAPVQNLEIESKRRGQAESDSPRQSEDAWVSWLHSDQAKLLEEGVPLRNRNLKGTIDGHHSSLVESDLHSSPDQLFFGDPHFRSRDVFDSLPPVTLDFSDNTVDIVTPGDGLVKRMFKKLFRKPIKPSDQKRILSLEGFHGCFKPGDCVALMGSSGAGKTTLLNVLSGRITKNVGGRVDFNGRTLPPQVSKALSCFVQQDVMFFGALTVQEHLSFQAAVRLPPFVSKRERQEIVRSMLDKVGLTKCRDSRIGNVAQRQFNGISGGEQRRLSVATELLTHPCIIFADEPTSGLDSFMAMQVVTLLRELADAGRTVVCTIHQPSSSVFAHFNKVVLLSEGRMLYCGDREASISWFEKLGETCEADMNPAEFLIKAVAIAPGEDRDVALRRTEEWAEKWRQEGAQFLEKWSMQAGTSQAEGIPGSPVSERSDALKLSIAGASPGLYPRDVLRRDSSQLGAGGESEASLRHARRHTRSTELADLSARDGEKVAGEGSQVLAPRARHVPLDVHLSSRAASLLEGGGASQGMLDQIKTEKINILKETWLQFRRSIILLSRDPFSTYVKLFTTLVTALIPSFMFFRLTWDRSDAWNKVSASFYIVLSQALSGLFGVMMSFSKDRPIIQREYEAGVTRIPAYFTGRVTSDSLLWLTFPFVYHLIMYWIPYLGGDSAARYFGSLAITLLSVQVMISYTYVVVALIRDYTVCMVVLQEMQMTVTLFSGFMVKLDQLSKFWVWLVYLSPFKYTLSCFTLTIFLDATIISDDGPSVKGQQFLKDTFGFDFDTFWLNIGLLFVLGICARCLAMFFLTWTSSRTKENQ